jgi:hypothetical protein
MSARPDVRPEDAPDRAPEDLERIPEDIEELFEEVVDDFPTDVPDLQNQGYLPAPDSPRGTSLVEQRVRDGGFVCLDTEDQVGRAQTLHDADQARVERQDEDRHEVTTEALGNWRERADERRAAYERAQLEAERRRHLIGRGLLTGLMVGLFMAWGITELILRTDSITVPPDEVASAPAEATPAPVAAPVEEPTGAESAESGGEKVLTTASLVTSPMALKTTAPTAETGAFDPGILDGKFKSWTLDDHNWWQFDFQGEEPLHLRWIAPDGNVKLEGWTCDNRINKTIGRCYVGQHLAHFAPEPGTWSLYACGDANASACAMVDEFEIAEGMSVSF